MSERFTSIFTNQISINFKPYENLKLVIWCKMTLSSYRHLYLTRDNKVSLDYS